MISVQEAFELVRQHVKPLATQTVPLAEAVGRQLADSITADVDSPPHDKSVMDGFAVRSADINAGNNRLQVIETIFAGGWPKQALGLGQATRIMTGAPLPEGADAVVMVEQTESQTDKAGDWVTIGLSELAPDKHVMRKSTNFSVGDPIFPVGHLVRPIDVGLLAEVGCDSVTAFRLPSAAVLPTGNELVGCQHVPDQGQIRNSNGPMLIALAENLNLCVTDLGIGRDDPEQLAELIRKGLDHDLLILSGGVSAGMLDLVPSILQQQGVTEVFHKVKMKPGKPIWFGIRESEDHQTVVFGLPGNPVSSLVGFHLFVTAAIGQMTGGSAAEPVGVQGTLSKDHQTRGDRPTYWPGRKVPTSDKVRQFEPLEWSGSSDLRALGQADGLISFPADSHDHAVGEEVTFLPF